MGLEPPTRALSASVGQGVPLETPHCPSQSLCVGIRSFPSSVSWGNIASDAKPHGGLFGEWGESALYIPDVRYGADRIVD